MWQGKPYSDDGAPLVYLSFDDGPSKHTARLLDRLAAHDTLATFFLVGRRALSRPDLVRATVAAGHQIGLHGWDHSDAWRTSAQRTLDSFRRTAGLLEDLTGSAVTDIRPPYGRFTPALIRWCRSTGRRLVMWDLLGGDFVDSATGPRVAARIVRHVRPGSIVVLHDSDAAHSPGLCSLDYVLPALHASGWHTAMP